MKRFAYLAALMMLSPSAQAGDLHSFVVGGHHVRVEVPRHCASLSCISWSIVDPKPTVAPIATTQPAPAIVQAAQPAAPPQVQPVQSAAPTQAAAPSASTQQTQQTQPAPAATSCTTPPSKPSGDTVAAATATPSQAPTKIELAATTTQSVPPPAPKAEPVKTTVIDKPVKTPAVVAKDAADTPLGDWQTEGKTGLVRIVQCGRALCGYTLTASTNTTGETVLSNMKSKKDDVWAGNIFSRSSGNTYYARMSLKSPNVLRVEACALGPFFCSGNNWTRIVAKADEMVASRRATPEPKS